MSKLTINKQIIGDKLLVELMGPIDEDADLKGLISLSQKAIDFDFEKVSIINSCGIREWIKFIQSIPAGTKVAYKNCPQIIIEQINMVDGFFSTGATIESFYAPYFCEKCNGVAKLLLKTEQIKNFKAPKMTCPKCSQDMEFDSVESQYFRFLKEAKVN